MPEKEKEAKENRMHMMQIRVEPTLWKRFRVMCIENDAVPSEVVRDVMRAMIRENDLSRPNNTYISFEEVARKKQIELRKKMLGGDTD